MTDISQEARDLCIELALPLDCGEPVLAYVRAHAAASAEAMRKAAAAILRKKAAVYHTEHGSYDGSTGVTEYPGNGDEWMADWEETADEIEALPIPCGDAP